MTKKENDYYLGIDIGGTKMTGVLFDGKKTVADYTLATPRDNLEHFMVMLQALLEPLLLKAREAKVRINGVGMGVPSVMNRERDKILDSPNLPIINNVKLLERLEEIIGIKAVMDNDVNCFLRGEMALGAGQKVSNVYALTIGTGIGGAWWVNNDIYRGAVGGGGEPGSMLINFEQNISLEGAFQKLMQNNPAAVAEEAYRGDVLAEKSFGEIGEFLGKAIANIVNMLEPELVIIGGGVVESSDLFWSNIKKHMKENTISPDARKNVKIIKSKLGRLAGAIGAALMPIDTN